MENGTEATNSSTTGDRCGLKRERAPRGVGEGERRQQAPLGTRQTKRCGSHGWREEEEEGFSVGWNMCGSILHAAHVPLTATVCLFSALASIVSYTLDRHQPPQPPPPPGHLNGRRSHRRILLDIYFSSPPLFPLLLPFRSTGPRRLTTSW